MKTAEGGPGVGEGRGENDDSVSPSRVKESGVVEVVAVGWVGVRVTARLRVGVLDGEAIGEKATGVAAARVVGVAVNSVIRGTAVGGVSISEQPVKRVMTRDRTSQILTTNC